MFDLVVDLYIPALHGAYDKNERRIGQALHKKQQEDVGSARSGGCLHAVSRHEPDRCVQPDADGREELYDFDNDPWETQDLAGSEKSDHVLESFRQRLSRFSLISD